jgi:hypothetical protein
MGNILLQLQTAQMIPLYLIYAKLCGENINGPCFGSVSDYQKLVFSCIKYVMFKMQIH